MTHKSWVIEVPHLPVDLFDGIADADDSADGSWDVSLDVEEAFFMVDSDDALVHHGGGDVAEAARHLFAFPDFAGVFALADGAWQPMRLRVSMRCLLTAKIPPFHNTLRTLTLARCLHIDKLAQSKMSWPEHEADGQEVLRCHRKLRQMLLGRQAILKEVADLWSFDFFETLFSATHLDRIHTILFFSLHLQNLASIYLQN